MNDDAPLTGGCLCGAVRFRVTEPPRWACLCHCESCRRQTGAASVPFIGVARSALSFSGEAPRDFESSSGVTRSFCGRCGSPIAYATVKRPDEVDLFVGTLDDPGRVPPASHVHTAERIAWLEIDDGLPQHARSGGGNGET